jgi:hypothetical protein
MTLGEIAVAERPPRTMGERLSRIVAKAPIHVALAIVGLIWLLPTIGLLITSFRPASEIFSTGWWEVFGGRFNFTLDNYAEVLGSVSVSVDDDRAAVGDALLEQQPLDLGVFDGGQPIAREGDRPGDVAATNFAVHRPAVVGGRGAGINQDEVRIGKTLSQTPRGDEAVRPGRGEIQRAHV